MSVGENLSTSNSSIHTLDEDTVPVETNGLRLKLAPFHLEHIYDYEPGGHHPVHLGDVYGNNGQYRIIHKLGSGGFSTVWLCRDTSVEATPTYTALKVHIAEYSESGSAEIRIHQLLEVHAQTPNELGGAEYLCLPKDHFMIDGPNGQHLAYVYPVLGPHVSLGVFGGLEDLDSELRKFSLHVVKAVQYLHDCGLCHGGLDGLAEDQVLEILGKPVMNPVLDAKDEPHSMPTAPQYLVYPIDWHEVDKRYIKKSLRLIDFGESFKTSTPPEELGIPGPYRAPELMLEKEAGIGSDLWALGCTIFEIRTGRKLFDAFDDDDDEYLCFFVQILGKLPEPWWSTTWKSRKRIYPDSFDEEKPPSTASSPRRTDSLQKGHLSTVHPSVAQDARSLKDKLVPGLWYMAGRKPRSDRHRDISQREQEVFADLLQQLLRYKPEERLSAEVAMHHEWFRL